MCVMAVLKNNRQVLQCLLSIFRFCFCNRWTLHCSCLLAGIRLFPLQDLKRKRKKQSFFFVFCFFLFFFYLFGPGNVGSFKLKSDWPIILNVDLHESSKFTTCSRCWGSIPSHTSAPPTFYGFRTMHGSQ